MSSTILNSLMIQCLNSGDTDSVISLLRDDCEVNNALDCFGNTALHVAAERGNADVVGLLVERGADVNATNIHGETAFISAIKSDHLEICKTLIEGGCELDSREICNIWGLTPLMYAVRNNRKDIVQCILKNRNCVNQTNKGGQTALFEACGRGYSDCAKILLKAGARPDTMDRHGQTCLLLAIRRGNADCVKTLLQYGSDPTQIGITIISGRWMTVSPMYAALLSRRLDIVTALWTAAACTEVELSRFCKDLVLLESMETQDTSLKDWMITCSSSPRSLVDLCFRAISFRIGFTPDRNKMFKALKLPIAIENRLMLLDG